MSNLRDSNIFQDFTVWIQDVGKIGEAPNFQPPEINIQTEEFRGGGMDGTVEIPMGIEKIEFDFELHTWDEQVFQNLGYGPGSLDVPITFRGYLLTAGGAEKGVIIETHSLIKSIKPSKVEPGKKASLSVHCSANYYRHEINGVTVTEIDVFNKITMIGGTDKTANARRILGFTY
ncbi:phage major tail tube protein [Bradyrhizobium barranii subsp. apii]|jgi:P2 family phage contractile tail tube protein|uniref:phage major tail tube protein n=1 Tax=Bradyrhizobium barranii TaxID=2992140 RepID=UPI001AA15BC5|nr:phage major tail tube protein [Bradyrhizobium barranii]UPT95378.1 phage major tail tube protein [Bradyrhizobium barranii subsp. apii]